MKKIYVHIGAGKCGSSSIQQFLSEKTIFIQNQSESTKTLKYYVIEKNQILSGKKLRNLAKKSPYSYKATIPIKIITEKITILFKKIIDNLKDDEIPVISSEGWSNEILENKIKFEEFFKKLNINIELFMVIRPPISWINSAWWQWGVWSNNSLEKWTNHVIQSDNVNWLAQVEAWRKIKGVTRFQLVDLNPDILSDFKNFLGISDNWNGLNNTSSSPVLLDFLIKYKEHYKRTSHNPIVEFKINKLIGNFKQNQLPFTISSKLQKKVIDSTYEDNKKLIKHFDDDLCKKKFLENKEYFSITPYKDRDIKSLNNFVSNEEVYEFIRILIDNLFLIEEKRNKLEKYIEDITFFDARKYLEKNQDIVTKGINPYEHFLKYGIKERRKF